MTVLSADKFVAPVTFGMAGVIYVSNLPGSKARDESWLHRGFRQTPDSTCSEWRGDDIVIVSYHHAGEAKTIPGSYQAPIPTAGDLQGLVFGNFFGLEGSEQQVATLSQNTLSAFQQSGSAYFRELNGSWVSVIWDRARSEAQFVRGVTGIQVLYVAQLGERIVFASDLRLFQASGLLTEVDDQSLAEFLHYLYVPAPRTLAKNCLAVLPGHVLTIGKSTTQEKYYAARFVNGRSLDSAEAIEKEIARQLPIFESKLLAAVADCIPASGRVALTLSGGKDSSVVAVALSKLCPDRVLALTVGQSNEQLNEAGDAARVCRALGLAHQCYVPTDDQLAQGIFDFARVQDQVIGDPAALPYFLGVSSLPSDCTVVLDGSGNDFYFGMPSWQKGVWHYKRRTQFQKLMPGVMWPLFLRLMARGPEGVRRLGRLWSRPVEESFLPWDGWTATELRQLFNRDISFADTFLWHLMSGANPKHWMAVNTEQFGRVWEPNVGFRKAVDSAHATGRGLRYPFVDNRFAAFINELPEQLKYKDGINKQILRAYMKNNLPREIIDKPKQGFIFDLNRLFMNPKFRWAEELQRAGLFRLLPTWSQEPIEELLKNYAQTPSDPRFQQRLYVLCMLVTVFAVKNGYDPKLTLYKQAR